jgi:hypothetical protein
MAVVSWNAARKKLAEALKKDYGTRFMRQVRHQCRNWEKLAEAMMQADKSRAYDAKSALRTAEFVGLSKQTTLDRLVDLPFSFMGKIPHGQFLWVERGNKRLWNPDEKEDALKKELQALFVRIRSDSVFADAVCAEIGLPAGTAAGDIEQAMRQGKLSERINRYSTLYAHILPLKTPQFDYRNMHYKNGSDRYYLVQDGRLYVRTKI